jgi:hypothetical protein
MRWQLEMLLLEMESSGPVAAIIQQVQNMEKRIQDLIVLFKTMPVDMRKEFEKSIEATEKSLPEFRATLKEARTVAEKTNTAIENVNKTTRQAQETASQFTTTAKAFETAVLEVRNLMAEYRQWQNPKEPNVLSKSNSTETKHSARTQAYRDTLPEEEKSGSTAKDYELMAGSIKEAAQEIRILVNDLQQPVAEEGTLIKVAGEFQHLIRTIFGYAVALVSIVFVFALSYRIATRRLMLNITKSR